MALSTARSTFVAPGPLSDYQLGIIAYKTGKHLDQCATSEQQRGWCDAESTCYLAYLSEMERSGVPFNDSMILKTH